jgi:O-antigen/teichoic acid export membrane protein
LTGRAAISSRADAQRASNPLPPGAGVVGIGLVVNGVCTYASLVVARRVLTEDSYSAFAVLWGLLLILGPGLFQPLQQEISRATAERSARGTGSRPVFEKAAAIGAIELALTLVLVLVAWSYGLDGWFHGRHGILASLLVGLAGYMVSEVVRGVLGGRQRFISYGLSLSAEGIARLAGVAVVAAGSTNPAHFSFAVAVSFVFGAAVGVVGHRPFVGAGSAATWAEITPALGLLLTMSLSEAFLLNVGPAAVAAVSDVEADAGRFLNALVIARLPLFLFQAVKIALLPSLATLAGIGDIHGVRRVLYRLLMTVAIVVAIGVLCAAAIGPEVVDAAFGDSVTSRDMALLAAANGGSMLVITLSVGLVALGRDATAATGWLLGVATFCLVLVIDAEPFLRVERALIAGFAIAGAVMAVALTRIRGSVTVLLRSPGTRRDPSGPTGEDR